MSTGTSRHGYGTSWGLATSLDLGLPRLGPFSSHDVSSYKVPFPALHVFHCPGKEAGKMPWLLGSSPPCALEGLGNSSQPVEVGLEAKRRGLVYAEQIQDRMDSGVR